MNKPKTATPYRCAVYFAPPPGSAWDLAGRDWLGRCARTGQVQPLPALPDIDASALQTWTAEPRRYGWHATLKAPFSLRPGQDLQAMVCWLKLVANRHRAFVLPPLRVQWMGDFLALRPEVACPPLQALADDCVTRLHHLALPLGAAELARRRRASLSAQQDQLLEKWGYPWVLDQFRFHFSLTGSLAAVSLADRERLLLAAQRHFELLPPCVVDRLSLFVEPSQGANFELLEQVDLLV